jgi:hypothetical protein
VLSAHLRLLAHQLLALGLSLSSSLSPSHLLTPSHPHTLSPSLTLSLSHSLTLSPPRPSWRTGKHPRFRTPFWYSSDIRKVELQCKRELRHRPDFGLALIRLLATRGGHSSGRPALGSPRGPSHHAGSSKLDRPHTKRLVDTGHWTLDDTMWGLSECGALRYVVLR